MWETVLITGTSKPSDGEPGYSPILTKYFEAIGVETTNADDAKYFISFNHEATAYRRWIAGGGSPDRAALIRLEPYAVFPRQYAKSIEQKYRVVISPGSIEKPRGLTLPWPYAINKNPARPKENSSISDFIETRKVAGAYNIQNWLARTMDLSMVLANKVSPTQKSNYSLRRNIVRMSESESFFVYGDFWNASLSYRIRHRIAVAYAAIKTGAMPNLAEIYGGLLTTYPNIRGSVDDKHHVALNSKFTLVIENSDSVVTEKLWDVLINGSIPLYRGANLSEFGINDGMVFYLPEGVLDVVTFMKEIKQEDIVRRLSAIQNFFIQSDFEKEFSEFAIYRKIAEFISKELGLGKK